MQDLPSDHDKANGLGRREQTYQLRSIDEITRICRRILGPGHDHESVACDIWIKAWMEWGCTTDSRVPCPNIMIRRWCIDVRRSHAAKPVVNIDTVPEDKKPIDERAEYIDVDLWIILLDRADLTSTQEEILVRHFVHNQSLGTIAKNMSVTMQYVTWQLHIAVDLIQSTMRSL